MMPVHRYGQSIIDMWTHFLQAIDSAHMDHVYKINVDITRLPILTDF